LAVRKTNGQQPYDWTVILGGTNDLGYGQDEAQTFRNLAQAWDVALANQSKVLVLTVPEAGMKSDRLDAKRKRLNKMITDCKKDNLYVSLDIAKCATSRNGP